MFRETKDEPEKEKEDTNPNLWVMIIEIVSYLRLTTRKQLTWTKMQTQRAVYQHSKVYFLREYI